MLFPEWNSILYQNIVLSQATKEKSVQNECKRFPLCISSDFICLLSNQFWNFLGIVTRKSNDYWKYSMDKMIRFCHFRPVDLDQVHQGHQGGQDSGQAFMLFQAISSSHSRGVNSIKLSSVFAVLWCSPLFKVILKISYLKFY